MTLLSLDDIAIRGSQKAAVLLRYLALTAPRPDRETRGSVNNGELILPDIGNEE